MRTAKQEGIVKFIQLDRERIESFERYPYCIPAIRDLARLDLNPEVALMTVH